MHLNAIEAPSVTRLGDMLGKIPIKVSAPLLVALPVLIVGIWLSLMWSSDSRKSIEKLASQSLEEIHSMVAQRVDATLSMPPRVTKLNAHLINQGLLDPDHLEGWRDTFIEQSRDFDMLTAITWGAADGQTAWVSRYADGHDYWAIVRDPESGMMEEYQLADGQPISEFPTNAYPFDVQTRPWFAVPKEAGQSSWTEPYQWIGGTEITYGISFGIPIYDNDGSFVGVIDADFSLNDLSSFMSTVNIGETGAVALIDESYTLLASSSDAPIYSANGIRLPLSESSDPLLAAAHAWQSGAETQRLEHSMVQVGNERFFLHQCKVGNEVGLQWKLISIVPESDFLGEVDAGFQRSTMLSLLAVILAGVIGWFASRWIVSPILELVESVRRIGSGDLETQVDLHHAPEYTQLGDEINEMTIGLKDRLRMRESLALAQEVQESLLPSGSPSVPGLDIAGHSTYCDETGGDYYDFIDISSENQNQIIIALGDVMGHGVAAAMLMATARGILRSRCEIPGSISEFLEHINQLLVPDTKGERFMTMLLLTMDTENKTIRWASAGHGPPIIYDSKNDQILELEGGGVPLGLVDDADYEEYVINKVESGHLVLCATDGVWEAKRPDGELYGYDRVHEFLRDHIHLDADVIGDTLKQTIADFQGPDGQDDDMTFVVIKVP